MTRLPAPRALTPRPAPAAATVPPPPVAWRGRDLAAVAGLGLVGVAIVSIVGLGIGWDVSDFTSPESAVILLLNGTVPAVLPYAYLVWRFHPEHRYVWRPGGMRAPRWAPALGVGLAVGLVWWAAVDFLALSLLIQALEYEPPVVQQELTEALGTAGWTAAAAVAAIVVIAPVGEELILRGIVFLGLARWIGPVAAAVISSLVFGLLHVQPNLSATAFLVGYALAFGLFACWLLRRWGSLWLPIGAHAASNAASVALSMLTGQG